jgi:hypothetical protein
MAVTTITGDMSHALDALPELEPKGIQRLIPQQPAPQPTPEGPGRVQELRDWISWLGSAGQPQVARNLRSIDASLRLMQEHLNVPWRRLFGTDAPQL